MNNLSFHITDITANSIRANASEIGLSVEEQDARIVIRITDNGSGMDAETARRHLHKQMLFKAIRNMNGILYSAATNISIY